LADEAYDLHIQFINLLSPVGDFHAVASLCSGSHSSIARREIFLYTP